VSKYLSLYQINPILAIGLHVLDQSIVLSYCLFRFCPKMKTEVLQYYEKLDMLLFYTIKRNLGIHKHVYVAFSVIH
jgi:hypothetical protein